MSGVSSSPSAGRPEASASRSRAAESQSSITGILLVGGASSRFGSPKALAHFGGTTLAERGWEALAWCDERLALGKDDGLGLPFPVEDDGFEIRAPVAGVVAGLRRAAHDVCLFLPVDCPLVGENELRALAAACRDAAVPQTGPLPGAYRRPALGVLEPRLLNGELALRDALRELETAVVELDPKALVNVNTPDELAAVSARCVRRIGACAETSRHSSTSSPR
jgi:molybdopterin-guanine dinucleotide biosynthesis protein A